MFTTDVNNDVDRSEVMTQPCLVNCVSDKAPPDGLFIARMGNTISKVVYNVVILV